MKNFDNLLDECREAAKEKVDESDVNEQMELGRSFLQATCPRCGEHFEVPEDGDTKCPHCGWQPKTDELESKTNERVDTDTPGIKNFTVYYTVEGKEDSWSAPVINKEAARIMTLERWPDATINKVVEGGDKVEEQEGGGEINVGDTIQVLDKEGNTTIIPKAVVADKDKL